jgi:hypothetical protein
MDVHQSYFLQLESPSNRICLNDEYLVATTNSQQDIIVQKLNHENDLRKNMIILDGDFARNIQALAIGSSIQGSRLCAASKDKIILWLHIDDIFEVYDVSKCPNNLYIMLCEGQGNVQHLCFEQETNSLLSACIEKYIIIFELENMKPIIQLEGHNGNVTASAFFKNKSHLLLSISEDRTFKIWDMSSNNVLYQSAIISSSPFTCVDIDNDMVAIGSEDGKVRLFHINFLEEMDRKSCQCRDLNVLNFDNETTKSQEISDKEEESITIISSLPTWKTQDYSSKWNEEQNQNISNRHSEDKCPIICTYFTNRKELLLVAHSWGVYEVNLSNYQTKKIISFDGNNNIDIKVANKMVQRASHVAIVPKEIENGHEYLLFASEMFGSRANLFHLKSKEEDKNNSSQLLNIFSRRDLPNDSPLKQEMKIQLPTKEMMEKKAKKDAKDAKKGKVVSKPVTFHSKIRSSGYSVPKVSKGKAQQTKKDTNPQG